MIRTSRVLSTVSILTFALWTSFVFAQSSAPADKNWPTRPVHIVVPFPPGGGIDFVARLLAQKLTEQTGKAFVVENRPGAAGVLGTDFVTRAAPDGYTFLITPPEIAIDPSMRTKLPYDVLKDLAPVSQLTSGQFLLASRPDLAVKTVEELIALAKKEPGKLTYSHSGSGSINHLKGEMFQTMAGIKWVDVPFKGAGPAITAAMGSQVDFVFASVTGLLGPVKSGKLRPIAVTGTKRFAELPDVPTVAESGVPGFDVTGWYGLYAPTGTPQEILRRAQADSARALNDPDAKEKLARSGNEPVASTPEAFKAFLNAEIAKWAKVVQASGAKKLD